MPPVALPVRVNESPFVIVVVLIVELLASGAFTFTVKYFLAIVPFESFTFMHTSYFVAAAGLIDTDVVLLQSFAVVQLVEDAFL